MRRLSCSVVVVGVLAAACSSSRSNTTPAATDAGTDATVVVAAGAFTLEVPCTDTIESVYADPGPLPAEKGAIIRCAVDKVLTKDQVTAGAEGRAGAKPFTSGARVYRVLFRTERGDDANSAGYSSAVVYVPDTPRVAPGSGKLLPVIVTGHGTKGQGGACAPSKTGTDPYLLYPIVGAGFALIAPDLAGFANFGAPNNPPNAFGSAADAAKSTLDGARALRKMFSKSVSDQVVLIGHSAGGSSVLSALALNESYGSGGKLAGVVSYAPLWFSQASWGALPFAAANFPTATFPNVNASAIWYVYTHGELLDGPGHGGDAFAAAKRDAVKNFVNTICEPDLSPVKQIGTDINDIYDPDFANSLKLPAGIASGCQNDLCAKWKTRFNADRPHIAGGAAQTPLLVPYGGSDPETPADRMACAFDRLDSDKANWTLCYQGDADHHNIVTKRADYVNEWVAARALGEPEPMPCKDSFPRPKCATPPPNEWP